ncbi:MAG: hypothetical protein JKY15_06805 [Deltaproteobacteria bacterium]|nr:hypothetical protein [Deltaproteobacteria bacterium]
MRVAVVVERFNLQKALLHATYISSGAFKRDIGMEDIPIVVDQSSVFTTIDILNPWGGLKLNHS